MRGSRRRFSARPASTARACAALTLSALALLPREASANNCSSAFASTCINDDNLWPHPGASHFLTVGGTETTPRGEVGFGLVTTYLSRPILLKTPTGGGTATDDAVDDQVNGSFMFTYGVSDRLELDAVVPVTFSQTGSGLAGLTGSGTGLQTTGMRDVRLGFAYAIVPRKRVAPDAYLHTDAPRPSVFSIAGRFEISAPTGDSSGFGSDGYAVWSPGIVADYRRKEWFAGAEIGLRVRPTEELEGARVGSQALVALGVGRDLLPRELLSVGIEAYMLPTFAEQHSLSVPPQTVGTVSSPNGQYIIPAEWMVSVRSAPLMGGDLQLQLGGGGSLPFSADAPITNPRFRFALSVRFAPQGRDSDGDGVKDADDKCPFVHGIAGNPAGEGCPASAEREEVDLTGGPPPASPTSTAPMSPPTSPR